MITLRALGTKSFWLKERGVPHGYAVALPNVRSLAAVKLVERIAIEDRSVVEGMAASQFSLGASGDEKLVLFHEQFNNPKLIEPWLRSAYGAFAKPMKNPLDVDEINHIKAAILGHWVTEKAPDPIGIEKPQFTALERRVRDLLSVVDSPRKLIRGVAGSGKTLAAVTLAKELDAKGQKVLFLTFNDNLASWIQGKLVSRKRVDVMTFHGLCHRVISMAGTRR